MLFPGTNLNKAKLRIWVVVEHDWNEKKNEWKDLPSENNLHLGALFLEYQYWFQKFMYISIISLSIGYIALKKEHDVSSVKFL